MCFKSNQKAAGYNQVMHATIVTLEWLCYAGVYRPQSSQLGMAVGCFPLLEACTVSPGTMEASSLCILDTSPLLYA